MFSRSAVKPEQAYFDQKDRMFFWSPDGDGGFWYITLDELEDQHGQSEPRFIVVDEIEP